MIERTNIKEAFGGEVPFTNYIAATASVKDRLLEVLELETDDAKRSIIGRPKVGLWVFVWVHCRLIFACY